MPQHALVACPWAYAEYEGCCCSMSVWLQSCAVAEVDIFIFLGGPRTFDAFEVHVRTTCLECIAKLLSSQVGFAGIRSGP